MLFSDVHCDWVSLRVLLAQDADCYLVAGDLVNWSKSLDKAGEILSMRRGNVYVIPGNHESETDITQMCQQWGLKAAHGRMWTMGGKKFAALGYSNPTPFETPGEYTEAELAARLAAFQDFQPEVLVCHCPPQGTVLDRAGEGLHFGSTAVKEAIHALQPEYFFCGHIHEAAGKEELLGRTKARNLGKRGYLLEWDDVQDELAA
ncbi:MAG: metallophosphoesterase [Bryobacter sp.]|nr:metallophosphoesterase [Bryobacter sp.]